MSRLLVAPRIATSFFATCATCGGVGLLRPASGTWGSAAAVACCGVLEFFGFGKASLAILALASFAFGVPAAHAYGRRKRKPDHSDIVIDEFAAQAGILVFVPISFASIGGIAGYVAAFLVFRICDIVKPFPARRIDMRWKNGWGVMLDDVAAGLWALLVLWLLERSLGVIIPTREPIWGTVWHFFGV